MWALFGGHFCQKRLCCKTTRSQSLHTTRHPGARDAISLTLKTTNKSLLHYAVYVVLVVKAEVGVFGCNGKNCMLRPVRRSRAAAQTVIWPSPSMIQALEFKYVSGMVVFYSVLPNAGSLATCDLGQLVI